MKDISDFRIRVEPALRGILNNWRVWAGDDEIRALHIGFDSSNAEIAVSLLTDREPYLDERKLNPFGARWPVADWRLCSLNATSRYRFPDAEDVLEWMHEQAERLDSQALAALNEKLKRTLFDIATGPGIGEYLTRFRRVASPFKVRVQGFIDDAPMDTDLILPR